MAALIFQFVILNLLIWRGMKAIEGGGGGERAKSEIKRDESGNRHTGMAIGPISILIEPNATSYLMPETRRWCFN